MGFIPVSSLAAGTSIVASFPGLQSQLTRWIMEGLVKLLRRMTSGGRKGGRRTFGGVVLSV